MSSTSTRNSLFTILAISVFSFVLGISVGYALWFKIPAAKPEIIPTTIAEQPENEPLLNSDDDSSGTPIETDVPEASREASPTPSIELASAPEESPDRIHVARHLFIAVNGQWLAEGTQKLIAEIQPGGVVLRQRNIKNPAQTQSLIDEIKKHAGNRNPAIHDWPIIAIGQEGGSRNTLRLDVAPDAATLASYQNETTVEKLGQVYARDAYERGIGVMLGPVLDLYDEGGFDPSYAHRAFGTDQTQVSSLGMAMATGFRSEGMIPVIKHFPGYGSATYDEDGIHLTLNKEVSELAKLLYPFSEAVRSNIEGIMVGHVAVPALDKDFPKRPAALSPVLVDELLRNRWGFDGVILADDVAKNDLVQMKSPAQAVVEALKAGCDAVLFLDPNPTKIREAVQAIRLALDNKELSEDALLESQKRLEEWRTKLGAVPPPEPDVLLVATQEETAPPVEIPAPAQEETLPTEEKPVTPQEETPAPKETAMVVQEVVTQLEEANTEAPEETPIENQEEKTPEPENAEVAKAETEELSPVAVEEKLPEAKPLEIDESPMEETTSEKTPTPDPPVENKPIPDESPTFVAKEAPPTEAPEAQTEEMDTVVEPETQEEPAQAGDALESEETTTEDDRILMASAANAIRDTMLKQKLMEALATKVEEMEAATEPQPAIIEVTIEEPIIANEEIEAENDTPIGDDASETDEKEDPAMKEFEESSPIVDGEESATTDEEEIISPEPKEAKLPAPELEVESEEQTPAPTGAVAAKPSPIEVDETPKPDYITHTVKYNETLEQIGLFYGVTKDQIIKWNELDPPLAKQGTLLKLLIKDVAGTSTAVAQQDTATNEKSSDESTKKETETPTANLSETTHTVVKGDSLSAIAVTYNVKMDDIILWNKMVNKQVQLGKKLTLFIDPDFKVAPPVAPEIELETTIHVVVAGDTISNIARRYITTRDLILKINGITNPNHIQLGQKLKVPVKKTE